MARPLRIEANPAGRRERGLQQEVGAAISAVASMIALAAWPFVGRPAVATIAAVAATLARNVSPACARAFTPRRS